MSYGPRTRAHEIVEGNDPHPNLERQDFAAIVERDSAESQAALALSSHAETVNTPILNAMATAQATALRETAVAEYPNLEGKTEAEIVAFVNH
jgi:hypothetical protein